MLLQEIEIALMDNLPKELGVPVESKQTSWLRHEAKLLVANGIAMSAEEVQKAIEGVLRGANKQRHVRSLTGGISNDTLEELLGIWGSKNEKGDESRTFSRYGVGRPMTILLYPSPEITANAQKIAEIARRR